MKKIVIGLLASLSIGLAGLLSLIHTEKVTPAFAGVTVGNEYIATTTAASLASKPAIWSLTATSSTDTSTHTGTFGSIIQTEASATLGHIDVYDATTTDATKRSSQFASSSILIASLPTNAVANTYVYDAVYRFGLIVISTGGQGTTTITTRPVR